MVDPNNRVEPPNELPGSRYDPFLAIAPMMHGRGRVRLGLVRGTGCRLCWFRRRPWRRWPRISSASAPRWPTKNASRASTRRWSPRPPTRYRRPVAALFSQHAQGYQAAAAQVAAFHSRFVQALTAGAGAYAFAEAANASPLQSAMGAVSASAQTLLSRPLSRQWPPMRRRRAVTAATADGYSAAARSRSSGGYLLDEPPDMTPSFPRTGVSGHAGAVHSSAVS